MNTWFPLCCCISLFFACAVSLAFQSDFRISVKTKTRVRIVTSVKKKNVTNFKCAKLKSVNKSGKYQTHKVDWMRLFLSTVAFYYVCTIQ